MAGGRKDWAVRIVNASSKIFLSPFFRLEIEGVEKLPRNSSFVLLPKHQRWEDIPLLSLAVSRPLYYIAKYELFRNPISSCFLKSLGGIPLHREKPLKSRHSLNTVIELLKKGAGVVVFPEGTYYKNTMGLGQSGMIRLILSRLDLPFFPVGIRYSDRGWQTSVMIKLGDASHADSTKPVEEFVDSMMNDISRLSGLE